MSKTFAAPRATIAHHPPGSAPARAAAWHFAAWLVLLALCMVAVGAQASGQTTPDGPQNKQKRPNILFIIMDDVGMDQMRVFTYGGATPPATPTIDTLANEGIRFRNTWSMPACSTSRSVIYTGRFPFRTRVYGALGPSDLANSQVSAYEMTLPKLLHNAHYKSALFGKFHLGLQGKNPFRDRMPHALGWDYFYGWLDDTGDPSSIDTTAGNVAPVHPVSGKGPYDCGFVPSTDTNPRWGADVGACYAGDGSCQELQTVNGNPPGRQCRDGGGIFDRNQSCNSQMPANIRRAFDNVEGKFYNAHYVSPLVINDESGGVTKVPSSDLRARTYRGSVPVDAAIDWIKSQPKHQPWMASVSFASAHTPIMQPPQALIADDEKFGQDASKTSALTCVDEGSKVETAAQRAMTNMMITAMDAEIGRLLESTGLARRAHDGTLKYNPHNNDTMIVIVGDNGTLGNTVKLPFDGTRAKGTAYQTGVWVPLIVSGPLVKQPDRDVRHMVNIADLYQLFGEIAGIDVPGSVPRRIDAVSMLPYLKYPTQASLREWNYTEVAPNLQPNLTLNPPCVINTTCTQIPVTASVCTDNGGTWYGETLMNGKPKYPTCCSLNAAIPMPPGAPYSLQPLSSEAVRNEHYKLVKNRFSGQPDPSKPQSCGDWEVEELYEINERKFFPKIDRKGDNLKSGSTELTRVQKANLLALRAKLAEIRDSEPPCPGDGNIDGQVNENDVTEWAKYAALPLRDNYNSSWYDFNFDGLTDDKDLVVIRRNLGNQCVR